ncbi:MAG: diguanylate cyclase, partial [Polyangiaceae bacterium]|nr:diguanylate cyclase [Polyangiaceae bacterium]
EALSFPTPSGPSLSVTASIGVATLARNETVEAVIARADAAMYRAKSAGRNRVVYDDQRSS